MQNLVLDCYKIDNSLSAGGEIWHSISMRPADKNKFLSDIDPCFVTEFMKGSKSYNRSLFKADSIQQQLVVCLSMEVRLTAFLIISCSCERLAASAGAWVVEWQVYTVHGIYNVTLERLASQRVLLVNYRLTGCNICLIVLFQHLDMRPTISYLASFLNLTVDCCSAKTKTHRLMQH